MNTLNTDTDLLNFLEKCGEDSGLKWIARKSSTGRGFRLHQDPYIGVYNTAREALDAAIKMDIKT